MSHTATASANRFRLSAIALAATIALGATACSSSSKTGGPLVDPTTAQVAGTSVPPGYIPTVTVPSAAVDAIRIYELKSGPPVGSWTITSVQVSTSDPAYVLYRISPAAGHANVQAGYGFAHQVSGKWTVVGFGSDAVGCPPGAAGNAVVPAAVLSGFQLSCPG